MKIYLEEGLEWYDQNYRIGNSLITDKQFDQLDKKLFTEYSTDGIVVKINSRKLQFFKEKSNKIILTGRLLLRLYFRYFY